MTSTWHVTHRLLFTPLGKVVAEEILLMTFASGLAFTRAEWRTASLGAWYCGPDGGFTHLGHATPGGRPGRLDVESLGPVVPSLPGIQHADGG